MDSRDWAGLPDLVLDLIFRKLPSISDCLRFRALCKSWFSFVSNNYYALEKRLNSSSVEELPLLMICTSREKEFDNTSLYSSASKSKIVFDFTLPFPNTWRCCGSSHGWLAFQHESDLLIQLFNPFSRETINLPHLKYFAGKIIITKNPSTNPNNFEVAAMIKGWSRLNGLAILKPGSKFSGCKGDSVHTMENELSANHEYMMNIVHLQYGGLHTHFSLKPSQ
ncbi:uncharacterized protein LOC132062250 [Lycium ferocissimum]|uniref:uncharacterized protein LOC132062250 n=1 Tax=Lycium ferocissimum TaxID=112874 RepID=UPI0028161609|nr:uncharacterized protein LOC132062250 [Lycium ferocissimum]